VSHLLPLRVQGAETTHRGKRLVGPIDLTIEGAGATVIVGPNGSGKTTLLRLLHGAARLTRGEIVWNCPVDEAQLHQAFVFQRPVMLRRTVLENLSYPLKVRGTPTREARKSAVAWAAKIGLSDMIDRSALVLSGGEQQKLALARALITAPKVLFLDEPCAALDGRATREVEVILQAAKKNGTRLILSTHDMGQARRLADEMLFMLGGKIHEFGLAEAFFDNAKTASARAFLKGDIVE
jgi:tungstate transport system ATP-binding protein